MTVSIEPLGCGTLTAGRSMFEIGASDEPVELPVPAWLIRHPEAIVLFDTGMHPDLDGAGGAHRHGGAGPDRGHASPVQAIDPIDAGIRPRRSRDQSPDTSDER